MALEDYRGDMEICRRCSACKFIPLEMVTGYDHVNVCPSIARYSFHTYSGGGRMAYQVAALEGRVEYTDKLLEVVYNCQMCGACDVSCKYGMDMDVIDAINEFRIRCVEEGHTLPALDRAITSLQKQNTMMPGAKAKRSEWAAGLAIKDFTKEKTDVIYHVGCRTAYNKDLWKVAWATASVLQKAGVDFGIGWNDEACCGGRAYQMGYKDDYLRQAKQNAAMFRKAGAKTIVTGCAECYQAFKVLGDKFGLLKNIEIMHTSQYFNRLIEKGKIRMKKKVTASVTYHDPCYLGRLGEPYIQWKGKEIPGHIRIFDPPREFRRGSYGVYQPPREVLESIPELKLLEMDRRKEYAWCCGAGGGVSEANPAYEQWTARERIKEAETTGAEAIVTACPGCEKSFSEAVKAHGSSLTVYDIAELLDKAV
jgi:Fe-S oxidoreductase